MINEDENTNFIVCFCHIDRCLFTQGHTHERYSKEQIIQIAMSAGPENVSGDAKIISHDGTLLREGSNG